MLINCCRANGCCNAKFGRRSTSRLQPTRDPSDCVGGPTLERVSDGDVDSYYSPSNGRQSCLRAFVMDGSLSAAARKFDALAPIWDAVHGPLSARALEFAARLRYLLRARCRRMGKPRVLDLGCDTGQTFLHLADVIAEGTGVDISEGMIARAQRSAVSEHLYFHVDDAAGFCSKCPVRFDILRGRSPVATAMNGASAQTVAELENDTRGFALACFVLPRRQLGASRVWDRRVR